MYGSAKMILPMKAQFLPKKKGKTHAELRKEVCEGGEYFGQIKRDGAWYTFEKDMDGNCFLFSRVISKETGYLSEKSENVPHIIDFLNARVPNDTIIVGEVYFPNGNSGNTTEIMGCDPYKAQVRLGLIPDDGSKEWKKAWKATGKKMYEFKGLIHFYMHDILYCNGESLLDKDNETRYHFLEGLIQELNLLEADFMEFAEAQWTDLEKYIDNALDSGEEGVILRNKKAFFEPDTKPAWNWIKFKIEDEADVICLGFEGYDEKTKLYDGENPDTWEYWEDTGTGIFYEENMKVLNEESLELHGYERFIPVKKPYAKGWVSAIKIGVYKDGALVDVGTVHSGLNEEVCEQIKENPEAFIGQPLAVKYMEAFKGNLRHGAFLRFRTDDINASDCTWEKIFD